MAEDPDAVSGNPYTDEEIARMKAGLSTTPEVVAYVDRDGDVWLTRYRFGGEIYLFEAATREDLSWLPLAIAETHHGPMVPLVREDVVAAREAAAYARGRTDQEREGR